MGKEKSRVVELREKLQTFEKNLAREKARGREPSAIQSLDVQVKETIEAIGIAEAEERATQRKPLIEKALSILEELQKKSFSQTGQWEKLRELYHLAEAVENLCGTRWHFKRVDFVKCKITDKAWRLRKLPSVITIGQLSPGQPLAEIGSRVDKRYEGAEVFESFQFEKAKKFESEGRVVIIDEANPQYEEQSIADQPPEVLNVVSSLDLGLPISLNGDDNFLPEFQKVKKELGFFRINFQSMSELVKAEKQAARK